MTNITQIMPADGWRAVWSFHDEEDYATLEILPLVSWALYRLEQAERG